MKRRSSLVTRILNDVQQGETKSLVDRLRYSTLGSHMRNVIVNDLTYTFRWVFFRDLILLAIILFIENMLIYMASSIPSWDNYVPLKDTLKEVLIANPKIKRLIKFGSRGINGKLTDTGVCVLIWIAVSALFVDKGMQLLQRGIRTLHVVRFIRWFTFTLTILPSPRGKACLVKRGFVYVPDKFTMEWFKEIVVIRNNGGCHDLLFSGHTVIYCICGLVLWKILTKWWQRVFIVIPYYVLLLQKVLRTIVEGHHYSADIVVAIAITFLAWNLPYTKSGPSEPEEKERNRVPEKNEEYHHEIIVVEH